MERFNTETKRNPDGTFANGTAPGPGRPEGKSLKEFWRQRFADMTDEEKEAFSVKVSPEVLWKMAEGNPHQTNDTEVNVKSFTKEDEKEAKRVLKEIIGG